MEMGKQRLNGTWTTKTYRNIKIIFKEWTRGIISGKKERSKDRSSSNSPIDFVDSPKPKINIKTTIPKKMSKGRVEPLEKIPEKNSRTRNGDSTKRGRPGKTLKIMQDPQTRHALEAFETAQIRSHRSHHNNARQNSLTKKQIDEAWDVATEVNKSCRNFSEHQMMILYDSYLMYLFRSGRRNFRNHWVHF